MMLSIFSFHLQSNDETKKNYVCSWQLVVFDFSIFLNKPFKFRSEIQ